nr:unnamed protein product [Callosobruchus analis]
MYELFFEGLERTLSALSGNIIILGDFNAPGFVRLDNSDRRVNAICTLLNVLNLQQCNNVLNGTNRLLDLVLSNLTCNVQRSIFPLVSEEILYHPALEIVVEDVSPKPAAFLSTQEPSAYNFRRANFPLLYEFLFQANWSFLDNINDIDLAVETFYEFIYNIFETYVPKYLTHSHTYPPWFTREIISNIKLKAKYFRKHKLGDNKAFHEFKRLRSLIRSQIRLAYKNYLDRVQASIPQSPEFFWNYIHSKNKTSRIPGRLKLDGNILDSPNDIINGFADYFSSVFVPPSPFQQYIDSDICSNQFNQFNILFQNIKEEEIMLASKKLKNKSTMGPDNIPSFMVKDCISVFLKPLMKLFNLSVDSGIFPSLWKESKVCPIPKSSNISDIENYRPISILSNFAKLLEIVIYNRIYSVVRGSLSTIQHGFLDKRSTITNLMLLTQFASECVDKQGQVDVIYTDFAKAFDKIDHQILLQKLSRFGFLTSALRLLESYLNHRQQFVI